MILFAKSVDGVYDSDPKTNPEARKYSEISIKDIVSGGLGVVDGTALPSWQWKIKCRCWYSD